MVRTRPLLRIAATLLLAAVALVVATGLIGYAMRDGINFFRAPSQIVAEPP